MHIKLKINSMNLYYYLHNIWHNKSGRKVLKLIQTKRKLSWLFPIYFRANEMNGSWNQASLFFSYFYSASAFMQNPITSQAKCQVGECDDVVIKCCFLCWKFIFTVSCFRFVCFAFFYIFIELYLSPTSVWL